MLTIKRHFPINRLALSKAWYETKHFFGRTGHSLATGVASLRARSHSMGKKSMLSSLVVLVGFFGSLSALLILYPITTQQGGPLSAGSPQANVESQAGSSVTESWMKDGESATGTNDSGAAPAGQTPAIATSPAPVSTAPSASAPGAVAPAPAVQSAPVTPQPALSTAPSTSTPSQTVTDPAPAPSQTSPLPTAPAPTDPAPIISIPPLNTAPLTDPVGDAAGSLLN